MLTEVTDPKYQGEIGLLLHNGGKKDYVETQVIILGICYYYHAL